MNEALMWTDGRYFRQALQQLYPGWMLMKSGTPNVPRMTEYIISVRVLEYTCDRSRICNQTQRWDLTQCWCH